jgi:hypothetical protein
MFVRLLVALPACGETTFEDIRESFDRDGLRGSGQSKHLVEIPGGYLLVRFSLKTRRYDVLQVSQKAGSLAINRDFLYPDNIPRKNTTDSVEQLCTVAGASLSTKQSNARPNCRWSELSINSDSKRWAQREFLTISPRLTKLRRLAVVHPC